MFLSWIELSLACLVVTLGAVLQASTGLGGGLVVVPLLALIQPALIPGPAIFASLMLTFLMAFRGRQNINFNHMDSMLAGICVGSIAGAWLIAKIQLEYLGIIFGGAILFAILISMIGLRTSFTRPNAFIAGSLSALMGTTAGIGAPVLALFYQYEEGKALRATLAFLYFSASIIILLALHRVGKFSFQGAVLGLQLIPGSVMGYALAGKLAALLDRGYSRAAVLLISSVSAMALIYRDLA